MMVTKKMTMAIKNRWFSLTFGAASSRPWRQKSFLLICEQLFWRRTRNWRIEIWNVPKTSHTRNILFSKCEVEADSIWEWCRTGYFSKWWSWSSWNQTIGLLGHVPSVPTMLFINWLVLFKVVIITSVNSEISCEKCDHVILLVYQSVGS